MTESDWTIVLQVFRASRSRRGDQGRDDRKFLEISAAAARLHLTGGEASDTRNFEILLDLGPNIAPRAAITNKGYVPKPIATVPADVEYVQSFHTRKRTRRPAYFPKLLYKARARIEQGVGKLKRIALLCARNRAQLRILRGSRTWLNLDQIRPRGLASDLVRRSSGRPK